MQIQTKIAAEDNNFIHYWTSLIVCGHIQAMELFAQAAIRLIASFWVSVGRDCVVVGCACASVVACVLTTEDSLTQPVSVSVISAY